MVLGKRRVFEIEGLEISKKIPKLSLVRILGNTNFLQGKGKEKKGKFRHEGNVEKSGLHCINPFISTRQLK